MTIVDKSDLFFHDYSIGPLFVQENYIHVTPFAARLSVNDVSLFVSAMCLLIRMYNKYEHINTITFLTRRDSLTDNTDYTFFQWW